MIGWIVALVPAAGAACGNCGARLRPRTLANLHPYRPGPVCNACRGT